METYENIERTIKMAKRFFGTDTFTSEKFEQYSEDIGGSSFHSLYEHDAITETGKVKIVTWVIFPQEFAYMVNKGVANTTDYCKWKWHFDEEAHYFIGTQFITMYRMV